jgi:DNA-binding transcriptional LysR family regulator
MTTEPLPDLKRRHCQTKTENVIFSSVSSKKCHNETALNLSIRQLRYICEVTRLGSIQAASRTLAISQSSIIAAIAAAEFEAGAKLFERKPAVGITPTPTGRRFVRSALSLLAAEEEFTRAMREEAAGVPRHIRVGCFEPFGAMFMPSVMRRYLDEVGEAEVSFLEGDNAQLTTWLANGDVDFAVAYDIGPDLGQSTTPICRLPAHALLSADNPLAGRTSLSIAELAEHPLVLLDLPHTSAYLLGLFESRSLRPRVCLRTRSYETIRSAVSVGFGVSVLNMRPLNYPVGDVQNLVRVPLSDDLPAPTLQVTDMYGPQKPRFVRRFIAVLRDFFVELGPSRFAVAMPEREPHLLYPGSG